jgi:hypothetical protein
MLCSLVDQRKKNLHLLEEDCSPVIGAKEAIEELRLERELDEERFERKSMGRRQHTD